MYYLSHIPKMPPVFGKEIPYDLYWVLDDLHRARGTGGWPENEWQARLLRGF